VFQFLRQEPGIPDIYITLYYPMGSVDKNDRQVVIEMTMAEGMQHIVEDIDSSRAARMSDIRELNTETAQIRADAHRTLASFRSSRNRDAAALHRTLRSAVKANRKEVRNILHEARGNLDEFHAARTKSARKTDENLGEFVGTLKKDVANIRIDANNMIHGFAEEQLSRGIELSRMLKNSTDRIIQDVGELMEGFAKRRLETRAELTEGHEVWQRYPHYSGTAGIPGMVRPVVKKAGGTGQESPDTGPEHELQAKILNVVQHSPKGISLAKAGKKLDIEWRKLVGPAKHLLASGKIRKKETSYFPVL
jgi:hypothetical protein